VTKRSKKKDVDNEEIRSLTKRSKMTRGRGWKSEKGKTEYKKQGKKV
jgi:hypothetical protein